MVPLDLSDTEWGIIQPLMPNKLRGVARVDDQRALPERYGPHSTVYNRFNRRANSGD